MNRISKRSFVHLAGWGAVAALTLFAGCSKKEETTTATTTTPSGTTTTTSTTTTSTSMSASSGMAASAPMAAASGPMKIAFAYVGPVGDGGWTFAHDNARKALEKELGDKISTSYVEKVPEGPRRRARVPRHGEPGQPADLRHHLRLHGADAEGGGRLAEREVRARHRLQDGAQHERLRQPHLRRCVHGRHRRRRHDQDQRARRRRLGADPRGHPQHRQLHDGRAVGQPEDQDQGRVGQRVVQTRRRKPTRRSRSSTAAPTC